MAKDLIQKNTGESSDTPEASPSQSDYNSSIITADIDGSNIFRPYTVGVRDFQPSISTILLLQGDSKSLPKTVTRDSIARLTKIGKYFGLFKNFSLTNYEESREEALNIMKAFGKSWIAFFYGDTPRLYRYTGHFLDYANYNYYEEFIKAYDYYLRGSKCLENNMTMYLSYNGRLIRGLITSIITMKTTAAAAPTGLVAFAFSVLVLGDKWIRNTVGEIRNDDKIEELRQRGAKLDESISEDAPQVDIRPPTTEEAQTDVG